MDQRRKTATQKAISISDIINNKKTKETYFTGQSSEYAWIELKK